MKLFREKMKNLKTERKKKNERREEEKEKEITEEEVNKQIKKVKNGKAAGSDGIQNKAYLYSGRAKEKLIKIIMKVWRGGGYPEN